MILDTTAMNKASAANRLYTDVVHGGGSMEKLSELHRDQLQHYLRESSVMDKVMVPETITSADCEIGTDHDSLYKRIWLQPETRVFMSSFESLPRDVQEVFVQRMYVSFYMMSSPKIVFNDYNLAVYPFPVAKQIEDIIGPAMHEGVDHFMHSRLEEAIQASHTAGNGNILRGVQAQADIDLNGANTRFRGRIEREDIITLKKAYAGTRARIAKILMTDVDYIDFERFKLDEFGDALTAQVFTEGLSTNRISGVEIIRTIKSDFNRGDLLRPGNIYAFPDGDRIGRSYILQGLRFFVERDHQFMFFDAQQARGFIWAVTAWLFKLELYNGGLATDGVNPSSVPNGSDAFWSNMEDVTFKDYFNFSAQLQRPKVLFS